MKNLTCYDLNDIEEEAKRNIAENQRIRDLTDRSTSTQIDKSLDQIRIYRNILTLVAQYRTPTRKDLERENAELCKKLNFTYCAYCGKTFPTETSGTHDITEHIKTCPDHPMRALERQNAALKRVLSVLYP